MTNFATLRVAAILTILSMFSVQAFCASKANGPPPQAEAYEPLGHPTDEPIGGQPPTGATCMIQDFGYQLNTNAPLKRPYGRYPQWSFTVCATGHSMSSAQRTTPSSPTPKPPARTSKW